MGYRLLPLAEEHARQVLAWRYDPPYDIYNATSGEDGLAELLAGEYYAVLATPDQLVGFFCFGQSARVPAGGAAGCYLRTATDIGLGLRPDLTGRGLGAGFLAAGLRFAHEQLGATTLRLSVLDFNQRAITVYQRQGFVPNCAFTVDRASQQLRFLVMCQAESATALT